MKIESSIGIAIVLCAFGVRAGTVREHTRTLGQRLTIEVSSAWADEQAPLVLDNPADKARRSGKPSLVVFTGPCG